MKRNANEGMVEVEEEEGKVGEEEEDSEEGTTVT